MWTIANLERSTADDGVTIAHWRVTMEDGEYSASNYGTCGFTPDPSSPDFVAFDDLTEADVLEWVYASVDKDEVEARLAADIESQKNPTVLTGLPW